MCMRARSPVRPDPNMIMVLKKKKGDVGIRTPNQLSYPQDDIM